MSVLPAPGRLIKAVFPRMAGKIRPGVIVHAAALDGEAAPEAGPSGLWILIATPATSRRTNQPARLPLALGANRPSWLTPAMTATFPPQRVGAPQTGLGPGGPPTDATGAARAIELGAEGLSAASLRDLLAWIEAIYGPNWREAGAAQARRGSSAAPLQRRGGAELKRLRRTGASRALAPASRLGAKR